MEKLALPAAVEAQLAKANVSLEVDAHDLKNLQRAPAGIFVCNFLLPGVDEWLLISILQQKFESFKIIHPYPTPVRKPLRPHVFNTQTKKSGSRFSRLDFWKKAAAEVERGTALGLVLDFSENWLGHGGKNIFRPEIIRQLRRAKVPIIPIHVVANGRQGSFFRKIFPLLPYSPGEPTPVNLRIGQPIAPADIELLPRNRVFAKFLQAKIFALGSTLDFHPEFFAEKKSETAAQPIAEPVDPQLVAANMEALGSVHKIASRSQFDVFIAPFLALPNAMFEIARLREMTFRAVGEGTGKSRDMDEYDLYYQQLIIWDRVEKRIVGGYRIGQGDLIFRRFGLNGFYTSSVFKFKPAFFPILQQAVELGRSYVVPDYQKHRLPLFLLWKGILHFMLAHPNYRFIYGPVSISKYYTEVSKSVIVEFVRQYFFDEKLAKMVKPRKPFRFKSRDVDAKLLVEMLKGQFENLENFVEDIEPAHFKVPVLFRQYLKQNARFIAFNVDPNFSDCLDGLMILDVQNLPQNTIEALSEK